MEKIATLGFRMEEELSNFIEENLYDDFRKRGISLYEKQCGPGLGTMMTFEYSNMLINIIREKSVIEITLAATKDKKESWDIYLIKAFLSLKNIEDNEERKRHLIFEWDIRESAKFLMENFEEINNSFNESIYAKTKEQLEIIRKERSKFMWKNK